MALSLDASVRARIAEAFQPLLATMLDLNLTLKQAHWNIRGSGFRSLHLHLDEIFETTQEFSDEIAERMVALDYPADGRAASVCKWTHLEAMPSGFVPVPAAARYVIAALDSTISALRQAQAAVADLDMPSEDLIIGMVRDLEKQRWMMHAEIDERAE